jgi:type I restriction enzyme S subunit
MDGAQTKYSQLFRAEVNDVIVNKIWARNGSVGVVSVSLSGCYGSGEFPMFSPDRNKVDPGWINWLTKTRGFWSKCDEKSQGTSGKNRIRPERFLEIEIFLPPLAEQRRIVARIEELAAQIHEARTLRHNGIEMVEGFWRNILREKLLGKGIYSSPKDTEEAKNLLAESAKRNAFITTTKHNNAYPASPRILEKGFEILPPTWIWTTVGSVLTHLIDCVNDTPDFADFDTGLYGLKSTNIRPFRLDLKNRWFMKSDDFIRWNRREKPLAGDIILTREAPMGYACLVPKGLEVCLTQRLMLLRSDKNTILPDFLLYYINSPLFRIQIGELSRGLTTPHIRVQDAPNFLLPLPHMKEQHRIVGELDAIKKDLDAMASLQNSTAAELDALLPSILDRAFKGEL